MKNALVCVLIFHSVLLMTCVTRADVNGLNFDQPKFFCGPQLTKAMKLFCQPEIQELLRKSRTKKSFDLPNGLGKVDNALEHWLGYYEDEDFQSDEGSYGYDWVPNYVNLFHLNSKRDGQEHMTITQRCCRNPCTVKVLTEFCPKRQ